MVEAKDQDMGDGIKCINHPFTKNPGGICAFCLQEKLGKLVTSSFPLPKHLSTSSTSSSSPSFRSDSVGSTTTTTTSTTVSAANLSASLSLSASGARNVSANNNNNKLPFLLAKKKNKMLTASTSSNIVYKRSQSTTAAAYRGSDSSPRKRSGFWSFLHLHSYKHHSSSKKVGNFHDSSKQTTTKHTENALSKTETTVVGSSSSSMSKRGGSSNRNGIDVIVEEDGSPNVVVTSAAPSERKVSRSRSVGCGSRSFSGDFFERITNGFGDCTLRRVESQREGSSNKGKVSSNNPTSGVREMVRCGGIFGGFMIMTSSSSSSSSSSWVSSSSAEQQQHQNNMAHGGRNRSWGWAFASPMRAFSSSSYSGKRGRTITDSTSKNTAPNLDAIPSLLAVKS
ncbi:hypothetical protein N665_0157s0166 [Sinapis alba]|nr:hypothetical protein N665_0157s0166 [Sinapis alba]